MEAHGGRGLQGAARLLYPIYPLSYETQLVPATLQQWKMLIEGAWCRLGADIKPAIKL